MQIGIIYNYDKAIQESEQESEKIVSGKNFTVDIPTLYLQLLLEKPDENQEAWEVVARNFDDKDLKGLTKEQKATVLEKVKSLTPAPTLKASGFEVGKLGK